MNKNVIFFLALNIFGLTTAASTTLENPKTHTLSYTFAAKENDSPDFQQAKEKLVMLFEDMRRDPSNNTNLYDKLLTFIKELQEAIIAGINLFSTASTSGSNAAVTVQEVAQTAETIVEALENANQAQTVPTRHRAITNPHIEIALTISCDNSEKESLFEELKTKMNNLAEAFNHRTYSTEELTQLLHDIIQGSKELGSDSKFMINIVG